MGAAGCKSSKLPTQNQQKDANKDITIGVFGLDNAGKTSTVKAIEGEPIEHVQPTMSSISSIVPNPLNDRIEKNRKQPGIKIIDVSGERRFRQKSWSQYYDQIHGLIFVIDASEKKRLSENQEILEDLLQHEKLKNKPVLILANKQDQRSAISTEHDLKRQLEIEKLKTKYKIELCTALPKNHKTKTDESIRKGFTWLIQTIDVNYSELNARVTKAKQTPWNTKTNRFESDDDSDNKYSKDKTPPYRPRITSEKLPSLNTNKHQTKVYSDDDDRDYFPAKNDLNKNKTVSARITSHNRSIKKSDDNEPKAFRSTYEPFPEETPWSSSSMLKLSKNDETFPRLNTKSSVINETKRKGMSPLIHDTKSYSNGSLSKRNDDDDDDFNHQQKSKSTSRFDFSTNKYPPINKKPTSSIYNDADDYTNYNNRRTITTPNKSYTHDDDDDDDKNYLKKSTTTRSNKDYDDNKNYQHSNLTTGYRGTTSKPGNHSTYDDDDDYYSTSKPITRSTYNNDHSTSKSTNRSKYNDDDDDDDDRWSSSKPATNSKYENQGYSFSSSKFATPSNYDHGNRSFPSSKPKSHSKFEDDDDDDDDYPRSKTATRSKYNDDDDDDDDYPTSSKKTNYGSSTSRSHVDDEDFFTTKDGSNSTSRFRKTTHYDS